MSGRINKKNGQKYLEILKLILLLEYLEARRKISNLKDNITLTPTLE